jgi:drug/metabolite transporter (DMT)-like permease
VKTERTVVTASTSSRREAAPHDPYAASRSDQRLAIAATLVAVVLWASAFVGIQAAGRVLSAGALSLSRLSVGSMALGLLVILRRERLPPRRDCVGIVACGLLWFGAYNVLLNQAERLVDAGTAAMLVNIGPIFVAVLSGLALREGFPRRLLIGCAIGFGGTVIIGLATSARAVHAGAGVVLCVAAAAAYAGGVTIEKPLLARNSALTVTWLACTVGAVACLPFAPQLSHDLARADVATVAWIFYLGALPTAVGFGFWAYALARTGAGRMGATTYLVPPVAIVMGWCLLGDAPAGLAFGGGAFCLIGVAVARGIRLPRRSPFAGQRSA